MAHLSRLPGPHDRQAGRTQGRLILAAAVALALAGCATGQGAYPAASAVVAAGRANDSAHSVLVWTATSPSRGVSAISGMPILLKDNIETADMPTTAGSLALANNAPGRDAPLVTRLRAAGAVIVGKTNLSEWANIRSSDSISGWSAVGGQTLNPYDPARTPCGSSSGSGAAMALGLTPVAIGTETDGSITCPASVNGVVGFKPTVGLVSRTHIVPISHSQDTAGPMATTVRDAARVLTVIAGSDPADPATVEADARKVDYAAGLDANALRGARIGVMRFLKGYSPETQAVFEQNLKALRDAGAVLVDLPEGPDGRAIGAAEFKVLLYELKHDLNLYLASTDPQQVRTRTLADVIAFNAAEPRETVLFGQDIFERAQAMGDLTDADYLEARATSLRLAGPEGIDRLMRENGVIALIAPTTSRAWTNDPKDDDDMQGSASRLAAVAGYPHLTVPMGFDRGMPVGISFLGGKWDDARILSLGYAFEQVTQARRPPPGVRR
ncbi:amidase [Brevundimonas sp. MEB006b]|uniref:amidase n=1 Tax=Brevundimonas sp. MEB006b TaxID=3040283 RepID=UPI002551C017|nr:amidase [Brevundimonas sp. MEB006b]